MSCVWGAEAYEQQGACIGCGKTRANRPSAHFWEWISFQGAIDEVNLLPHATAEVYRETRRIIEVLGRHGGFIVSPSHQVQGDTPPENVVAIYDAARSC